MSDDCWRVQLVDSLPSQQNSIWYGSQQKVTNGSNPDSCESISHYEVIKSVL